MKLPLLRAIAGAILLPMQMALGQSTFTKITTDPVVNEGGSSNDSLRFDYDNDGDLGLYVIKGKFIPVGPAEHESNGDGTFTKVVVPDPDGSNLTGGDAAVGKGTMQGYYPNGDLLVTLETATRATRITAERHDVCVPIHSGRSCGEVLPLPPAAAALPCAARSFPNCPPELRPPPSRKASPLS